MKPGARNTITDVPGIAVGNAEDDRVRSAFHNYLTARAVLRETVEDLRPLATARGTRGDQAIELRVVGFAHLHNGSRIRTTADSAPASNIFPLPLRGTGRAC